MNWYGEFDSNNGTQEFAVSGDFDFSGSYVLGNDNRNAVLAKFENSAMAVIDYSMVCVDSVWYDSINPHIIHVMVFNGAGSHMNYPSVQIVNNTGDTIGNPENMVNFFAHLGNRYQVYTDSITTSGITDFSGFTFLMNEGFGDTTVPIDFCDKFTGLANLKPKNSIGIFPNPFGHQLTVSVPSGIGAVQFSLFDMLGKCHKRVLVSGEVQMDLSSLPAGLYFYRFSEGNALLESGKLIRH
jgi:hypothetical protein